MISVVHMSTCPSIQVEEVLSICFELWLDKEARIQLILNWERVLAMCYVSCI